MPLLRLFTSLPVVQEVVRVDQLPGPLRSRPRDTITLGWEARLRTRGRRRSDAGLEFATALPRATVLREGDCFVVDEVIVEVIERSEAVLVVQPRTPDEWGLFAYHIGNSHQPLMITEDALVLSADGPGVRQVLDHYAIPYSEGHRPFTPLGFNAGHEHMPGSLQ